MSSVSERLKQYLDSKGINIKTIEESIGASNDSVGKHIRNKSNIGSNILEKIAKSLPDLNPSWLLVEKGAMILTDDINHNTATVKPKDIDDVLELRRQIHNLKDEQNTLLSKLVALHEENATLKEVIREKDEQLKKIRKAS